MATFTSPAPRRTHRYATPGPSSRTPPRTRRFVGAHRVAPTATPPPRSIPESGMEVDEAPTPGAYAQAERASSQKDTVFAKTEELIVGLYGALPVEVKQALRSTGARRCELSCIPIHHVYCTQISWPSLIRDASTLPRVTRLSRLHRRASSGRMPRSNQPLQAQHATSFRVLLLLPAMQMSRLSHLITPSSLLGRAPSNQVSSLSPPPERRASGPRSPPDCQVEARSKRYIFLWRPPKKNTSRVLFEPI